MAKALFSSGTLLSVGVLEIVGLRRLSIEGSRCVSTPWSFFSWFWRSISSCALSKVKLRNAWNFLRLRMMAYTKLGFSGKQVS